MGAKFQNPAYKSVVFFFFSNFYFSQWSSRSLFFGSGNFFFNFLEFLNINTPCVKQNGAQWEKS